MNLTFNFHNQLFWIHNFLPKKTYESMYIDFIKNRNKLDFKKSSVNWRTFKEEIDDMSQSYNQNQSDTGNLNKYLKTYNTLLLHQPFVNLLNHRFTSHLRRYKYNKHLAWHTDNGSPARKYAATFYFNRTWNPSWGGELMFKNNKGSGFIPIVGNSLVIVKTGLMHKVNPNLKKTHQRFSIQTWIDSE